MNNQNQRGFTMIELIVVIVVLGIIAAVAIPRYIDLQKDARIAALKGLEGSIRSSVALSKALYFAKGLTGAASTPITMADGTTVAVGTASPSQGIPTAGIGGIGNAVEHTGFAYNNAGEFAFLPTAIVGCNVTYDQVTGATAVDDTGC